jgi:hypothetical protein
MSKNAVLCLLATALLGGLAALAQDAESPDSAADRSGASQADSDVSPDADEPAEDDVFIPSEEVQAAEELVFPVNI